jgi:hypothetical protein
MYLSNISEIGQTELTATMIRSFAEGAVSGTQTIQAAYLLEIVLETSKVF